MTYYFGELTIGLEINESDCKRCQFYDTSYQTFVNY